LTETVYYATVYLATGGAGRTLTIGKLHCRPDCTFLLQARSARTRSNFQKVSISGTITEHLEKCSLCHRFRQ